LVLVRADNIAEVLALIVFPRYYLLMNL
jgi:hypothetical protein